MVGVVKLPKLGFSSTHVYPGSLDSPPAPPGGSVDGALFSPKKLFSPASHGALKKLLSNFYIVPVATLQPTKWWLPHDQPPLPVVYLAVP